MRDTRPSCGDLFVVNAKIFRGRVYALTNPRPVQLAEVLTAGAGIRTPAGLNRFRIAFETS